MPAEVERVWRLENPIQPYAWGSRAAIAELCGRTTPSPGPEAELWMGAHPKAPSTLRIGGKAIALGAWIERDPEAILGRDAFRRFGPCLPFLFKVLAAEEPLSIQAHPDRDQARHGFERENSDGIPLDAPHRNYRDDHHKPEILYALTPFWGLNGFRPLDDLRRQLQRFCPRTLSGAAATGPSVSPGRVLQDFFEHLLTMDAGKREQAIDEALGRAGRMPADDAMAAWLRNLQSAYPGDVGVLTPLVLNLVCLEPGQAMYLPAGQLHAYLRGTGIELMANSDNVLRGGLTSKHVDQGELMRVLRFAPCGPGIVTPDPVSATETRFPTPAREFELSRLSVTPDRPHRSAAERSLEILLAIGGDLTLEPVGVRPIRLKRGDSFVIPAAAGTYRISGRGEVFKAAVPPAS